VLLPLVLLLLELLHAARPKVAATPTAAKAFQRAGFANAIRSFSSQNGSTYVKGAQH
jgi:hypothetical protein